MSLPTDLQHRRWHVWIPPCAKTPQRVNSQIAATVSRDVESRISAERLFWQESCFYPTLGCVTLNKLLKLFMSQSLHFRIIVLSASWDCMRNKWNETCKALRINLDTWKDQINTSCYYHCHHCWVLGTVELGTVVPPRCGTCWGHGLALSLKEKKINQGRVTLN